MAKFNRIKNIFKKNHEHENAFGLDPKLELYNLVVTSFVENKFYESAGEQLLRLQKLIGQVEPAFVCKLAIYAREKMYLRSIPIILMVELLKTLDKNGFDRRYIGGAFSRIIQRADEITEVLACYQMANNRTGTKKLSALAKQVQFGIADAFNKFDEYQFAKYNRKQEISLKDALFLTHPKAKDKKQQELFNKIAGEELAVPYTWEVELSAHGNSRKVWQKLLNSNKLGYMALLRNLKNMLKCNLTVKYKQKAAAVLADKGQIRRSKQLPFRFYSAYREINELADSGIFIEALESAIADSMDNLDFFGEERILIASDVSGSMCQPLSNRSVVQLYDVGLLLSMLLKNKLGDRVTTGIFGDRWKVKNMPKKNILANVETLRNIMGEVGYSTNGYTVIDWALKNARGFDKIIFFTDCQMYDSYGKGNHIAQYWKKYKDRFPGARVYFFNLAGYNTTPLHVNENDVYLISGWSEKIFTMLEALEKGTGVLKEIEKVTLSLLKKFA